MMEDETQTPERKGLLHPESLLCTPQLREGEPGGRGAACWPEEVGVGNERLRGAMPPPWAGQQLEAALGHLRETVLGDGGLPPAGREGVQALRAAGRRAGRLERGPADTLSSMGAAGGERGPLWGSGRWSTTLCSPGNPCSRPVDDSSLGSPGDNLAPTTCLFGGPHGRL